MSAQVIVLGTLRPDGTLELDQQPTLSPGRVRVTVETVAERSHPARFWEMMEEIWADLKTHGHVPRSVEEIETAKQAFRDEWDDRQEAREQIHLEGQRLRQQARQAKDPTQ